MNFHLVVYFVVEVIVLYGRAIRVRMFACKKYLIDVQANGGVRGRAEDGRGARVGQHLPHDVLNQLDEHRRLPLR